MNVQGGEAPESNEPAGEHPIAEVGTDALGSFVRTHVALLNFLGFASHLVLHADHARVTALQALADTAPDEDVRAEYERQLKDEDVVRTEFLTHRQTILEMMLARAVDNFLTYLSELLASLLRSRPEMLKSGKQVRVDFVLEHITMADLVKALAERTVDEVSYLSLQDLAAYFDDRGLSLLPDADALTQAVRIVESRNLIVHNRSLVNERFIGRVGDGLLGERLDFTVDQVLGDVDFLATSAQLVDSQAIEHFGLDSSSIELA